MNLPWHIVDPIDPRRFSALRREAIFECCKWDPQIEDVCALSPQPLILKAEAWRELTELSERLARELAAAEAELLQDPKCFRELGLPWKLRRRLARLPVELAFRPRHLRLVRFDFHFTTDGWRISEANCDVPGGFNEASGFTRLVAGYFNDVRLPGDPTSSIAAEIRTRAGSNGKVALLHATAFSDDRQVMVYLSRHLEKANLVPVLAAPDHLRWEGERASLAADWYHGPIDFLFRFFPAEWLPELPSRCGWWRLLGGSDTGVCNPGSGILVQSKRFPLLWDRLSCDLTHWRALLPKTRDPRAAREFGGREIVLKSALGRVGDMVQMNGVTSAREERLIAKAVRRYPEHWVAQERFDTVPFRSASGDLYPCVGVYTLNGRTVGAYGRVARTPLVNHLAQDAAVLVAESAGIPATPIVSNELNRTLQNLGA